MKALEEVELVQIDSSFPWYKYFTKPQIRIIEFCLLDFVGDELDYLEKPDGYETIAKMAKALNRLSGIEVNRIMKGEETDDL